MAKQATRRGFFARSHLDQSKPPENSVPHCGACGLYQRCQFPKLRPQGEGRLGVLLITDQPQACGRFWQGTTAGILLKSTFQKMGVDVDRDLWTTAGLICYKGDEPTAKEIGYCRPNIAEAINTLKPTVIIPLGPIGLRACLEPIWKDNPGGIEQWAGFRIPSIEWDAWVCPTYHPEEIESAWKKERVPLEFWWNRQLEAAMACTAHRPWNGSPPDYREQVERIYNPEHAAQIIYDIPGNLPSAFDYECNMLKPDSNLARLVSCAISWGKKTIAFPWLEPARSAVRWYLDQSGPKIASNAKFEERWTLAEFGRGVANWGHDTMQAAHVQDSRKGITSLKFQAFTRLGIPVYDDHIKPYLQSNAANQANQILSQIELGDLLLYNGLDALLEFMVAHQQRKELNLGRPTI